MAVENSRLHFSAFPCTIQAQEKSTVCKDQIWKREVLIVDDENNELILPKSEQIPADQYHKGETVRAVIARVDNENNNPTF